MRLALAMILLIAGSVSAEPMRWKLEPGQRIRCQVVQQAALNMQAGPAGNTKTDTTQTIDMTWVVEQVNEEGAARVRHDIQRVRAVMTAPLGQGYQLDTASEEAPTGLLATMLTPVFTALVESDYTVTMTARGEITDINVSDDVLNALKNLPGAGASVSGESMIRQIALQATVQLPVEEPGAGVEWTTKTESAAPMIGTQVVETTYKYQGPRSEGDRQLDVFTPTVNIANAEAPAEGPALSLTSGDSGGELLFDRQAGRLVSSKVELQLDMNMAVAGQKITGKIDQQTSVTFDDAIPAEPAAKDEAN